MFGGYAFNGPSRPSLGGIPHELRLTLPVVARVAGDLVLDIDLKHANMDFVLTATRDISRPTDLLRFRKSEERTMPAGDTDARLAADK